MTSRLTYDNNVPPTLPEDFWKEHTGYKSPLQFRATTADAGGSTLITSLGATVGGGAKPRRTDKGITQSKWKRDPFVKC